MSDFGERQSRMPAEWQGAHDPFEVPLKHSELGIIACILALLAYLLIAGYLGIAVVVGIGQAKSAQAGRGAVPPPTQQNEPLAMASGLMGIAGLGVAFLGSVLGLIGVCMSGRKKLFAWLGLAGNGIVVLGCTGLFCFVMVAAVALIGGR